MKTINDLLLSLPENPGCYKYLDENNKIIYVGKAKNIKKRVKSYFTKKLDTKTQVLVSKINNIEYVITKNETEALLLEINLIKEIQPKYNILLKDDKYYPYIALTSEKHPKLIYKLGKRVKTSDHLFGPFTNGNATYQLLNILNNIFPLRKCQKLPKEACIYYHIGQCIAPCIKDIDNTEYDAIIKDIFDFFSGKFSKVKKIITNKMKSNSEVENYEKALEYKNILNIINDLEVDQIIDNKNNENSEFLYFKMVDERYFLYKIFIIMGKITYTDFIVPGLNIDPSQWIVNDYCNNKKKKKIYTNINISNTSEISENLNIIISNPKIGWKKKIMDMAEKNCLEEIDNLNMSNNKHIERNNALMNFLKLDTLDKIEMYDNSNNSGENNVTGMITYINGSKEKLFYRRFNQENSRDDVKSMINAITRRLRKLDNPYPELIILDGGIQHYNAITKLLESLNINIKVIGLVKDNKHKTSEVIFNGIQKKIEDRILFLYLSEMQEEVHRFAHSFHSKKSIKNLKTSFLDNISGIGEKRRIKIYSKFKSIDEIKFASIEDFAEIGIPENIAKDILYEVLKI